MNIFLFLIAVLGLCLSSCKRYVTFSSLSKNQLESSSGYVGGITIDDSYKLYARKVYEVKENDARKIITNASASDQDDQIKENLVEVEYLLISSNKNNVIYISTIPDRNKNRYASKGREADSSSVNIYDLNVILFGRLKGNEISFEKRSGDIVDVWSLDQRNGTIEVVGITENRNGEFQLYIPTEKALKKRMNFKEVKDYRIIFDNYQSNDNSVRSNFADSIIFKKACLRKSKQDCNKLRVYFPMDSPLIDGFSNNGSIFLKNRRIASKPNPLFNK